MAAANSGSSIWIGRQIKISTPEGPERQTSTFKAGASIPVFFASGKTIAVDRDFQVGVRHQRIKGWLTTLNASPGRSLLGLGNSEQTE